MAVRIPVFSVSGIFSINVFYFFIYEAHDYVSKAKGIFLGNLPFISIDSPHEIARMLVVVTDLPQNLTT